MKIIARLIKSFSKLLPSITIKINGKPYLTRYYLLFKDWKWFNIYIHHFHTSDQGLNLHNHPWRFGLSFIFEGGYREESFGHGSNFITQKLVSAPALNIIRHNIFHRVDLLDENQGAWSVFFTGPRITEPPEWGFLDRNTKVFTYYKNNPEAIP